jgi:hypothetical protein
MAQQGCGISYQRGRGLFEELSLLHHTKMAGELAALQAVVSSAVESMLGRSPDETFRAEVLGELFVEFWRLVELCSRLEWPGMRICSLVLEPPFGWAWWANRLDEATGRLGVKLAARWVVDTELDALRNSVVRARDLVVDNIDGLTSLAASLSIVVELRKGQIDTVATNGVYWGTRSTLVAALSHFPELKSELELLRSGCNADLTKDQADALWTQVRMASDSLAWHNPLTITRSPPDGPGE